MKDFSESVEDQVLMAQPQNYSVNDGAGIRTTLFFVGCPLKCKWCANPECMVYGVPNTFVDIYSFEEIMAGLESQKIFYRHSGGGVTFSGGEATMQVEILDKLSSSLYDQGISLTLETSGYFKFEKLKAILERMDLIFMDIKTMDTKLHEKMTGVSNKIILENIIKVSNLTVDLVIRIPVIEGVNASIEEMHSMGAFLRRNLGHAKVELLPYHSYGLYKYERLGLVANAADFTSPSEEKLIVLSNVLSAYGIEMVSYK